MNTPKENTYCKEINREGVFNLCGRKLPCSIHPSPPQNVGERNCCHGWTGKGAGECYRYGAIGGEGICKCKCHPTPRGEDWEEEFENRFTDRHGLPLARGNADELKAFIRHRLQKEREEVDRERGFWFLAITHLSKEARDKVIMTYQAIKAMHAAPDTKE